MRLGCVSLRPVVSASNRGPPSSSYLEGNMPIALVFFIHYAYLILFVWVLVEQIGIPVPSIPSLLTAGTLSATHKVSHIYVLLSVLAACMVADSMWFSLGR